MRLRMRSGQCLVRKSKVPSSVFSMHCAEASKLSSLPQGHAWLGGPCTNCKDERDTHVVFLAWVTKLGLGGGFVFFFFFLSKKWHVGCRCSEVIYALDAWVNARCYQGVSSPTCEEQGQQTCELT